MGPLAHALWGMTIIRRPDLLIPITIVSNLPDLLGAVPIWIEDGIIYVREFSRDGFEGIKRAHIRMPAPKKGYLAEYYLAHSFLAWGIFTFLLYILYPSYLILSLAYLGHLAVDIPSHSGIFGTRIFYPFSDWYVNSVSWIHSRKAIIINYVLLGIVNLVIWVIFPKYFL